jgi:hypothetical protein
MLLGTDFKNLAAEISFVEGLVDIVRCMNVKIRLVVHVILNTWVSMFEVVAPSFFYGSTSGTL